MLTIIAPAYNEAGCLASMLDELLAEVDRVGTPVEVLVVDDGSTDATFSIAQHFEDDRVHVERHAQNRGLGAAIRTGLEHVSTPYALVVPADGQWDPVELHGFVEAAREGVVLAAGVRDPHEIYGVSRRVLSSGYALLVRLLFGARCPDLAWVHLYDVARTPWRELRAETPFYPVEIALATLLALPAGSPQFRALPSQMRQRISGQTKVANPRVVLNMFTELVRAAWQLRVR